MRDADMSAALRDHGLIGWRSGITWARDAGAYAATLRPPGWSPDRRTGPGLVVGRGREPAEAFARAVEKAQAVRLVRVAASG